MAGPTHLLCHVRGSMCSTANGNHQGIRNIRFFLPLSRDFLRFSTEEALDEEAMSDSCISPVRCLDSAWLMHTAVRNDKSLLLAWAHCHSLVLADRSVLPQSTRKCSHQPNRAKNHPLLGSELPVPLDASFEIPIRGI